MIDWPALAFRPPSVRNRLPRASRACPLALRDLVGALVGEASAVPIVRAPTPAVARAALVAAKEAGSALGLAAPPEAPERWFDAVTAIADEIAPGLPLLLGATVRVGPGEVEAGRALRLAQRLVDAGLTHLALDLDAVAPARRAEDLARIAEPALERGLGVECLLPAAEGALPSADAAFALLSELGSLGAAPDLAGVRLPPAPAGEDPALAAALKRLADAAGGVPLSARGAAAARVARRLRPGTLRAADDGGAAAAAAGEGAPERGEARAYAEAGLLVDALGAGGSAAIVAAALARAREE